VATPILIGGAPVVVLRAEGLVGRPSFVEASVLPGRGFMLLQAKVALASGEQVEVLVAPEPAEAARRLDGGPEDFAGNQAFAFGGAILAPFANRIRGRPVDGAREIETAIDGAVVRLPRNWGGKALGAEAYAMHGLILATPVVYEQPDAQTVRGRLAAGGFGGRWPGRADLGFEWRLSRGALSLRVEAVSRGADRLPFGIGWHPYFRLPSGDRRQARLRVPAAQRAEVNNYDEVLPTGRLLDGRGAAYDFQAAGGRTLDDLYLDDCFTGLRASRGQVVTDLLDPAGGLGLRVAARSPPVRAVQVYAPPDQPFVVIEPQSNLPDPFGSQWPASVDTGMQRLPPGASTTYEARVSALDLAAA
jgi:galactose mutarotase-like enzyme